MDTADNRAPDGVVGPYREKEGSFYALKEIWSPVVVRRVIDREFEVENRFDFTNARDCQFTWQSRRLPEVEEGRAGFDAITGWSQEIELAPGEKRIVKLEIPPGDAEE